MSQWHITLGTIVNGAMSYFTEVTDMHPADYLAYNMKVDSGKTYGCPRQYVLIHSIAIPEELEGRIDVDGNYVEEEE